MCVPSHAADTAVLVVGAGGGCTLNILYHILWYRILMPTGMITWTDGASETDRQTDPGIERPVLVCAVEDAVSVDDVGVLTGSLQHQHDTAR